MRHPAYRPCLKSYEQYYGSQGGNGLSVFVGGRHQKGRGLGSLLSGVGRIIAPLLKSGGKALLQEGLQTGLQVVGDIASGRKFKSALRGRTKEAGKRLFDRAVNKVVGAPPGQPAKKRRINTHAKRKRPQKKKRGQGDIFD